uniref:Nuclear RNA export factor 1 n=1 Tax=Ascaris suum TaxID=6253 RepID=F1KXD7_ASCSU
MNKRGGHQKYDAKKMTMRRCIMMDSDLAPRFDEDDEYFSQPGYSEPRYAMVQRRGRAIPRDVYRGRGARGAATMIRNYLDNRRERQLQRGVAGAVAAVIMNLVRVPKGASIGKNFILRSIGQYVEDVKPVLLKTDRNDLMFYIEDNETANAIKAISRRIRDPVSNSPITFLVTRASAGIATVSPGERQLIEEALRKRYNPESHALDLSEFGLDELFRTRALHLALTRNNIMMTVVNVIDKYYGDVTALSVKGNRLRFLDFFACLLYRLKNVRTLDLSSNQIEKMSELEKLKGWPVETLFFEDNPICGKFSSADAYLSSVHHVFPAVTMLDGIPVQRASADLSELDDEPTLPPLRPSFYGNDERRALIEAFIIEYMTVYDDRDTNNRRNLIHAYDENATFSLSIANLPDANDRKPFQENSTYSIYVKRSHNIRCKERWERNRDKIVQKGAMDIVVELRKLPPTKHLMDTFLVDVSLVTNNLMCFAVQGFFRDGVEKVDEDEDLKYFCRNFVVVSKGEGKVAVVSDMLFISAVFVERLQRYKVMLSNLLKAPVASAPTPSTTLNNAMSEMAVAELPSTSGVGQDRSLTPAEMAAAGDEQVQQQMVEAFSRESKMKPEWSRKCLMDQNWNYEVAGQAFLAVRDKIPPEAFQ